MAKSAASAGAACRYHYQQSGKGFCGYEPKGHHNPNCGDAYPGHSCVRALGAEGIPYRPYMHPRVIPCEVLQ
jgi:hypothetical protein